MNDATAFFREARRLKGTPVSPPPRQPRGCGQWRRHSQHVRAAARPGHWSHRSFRSGELLGKADGRGLPRPRTPSLLHGWRSSSSEDVAVIRRLYVTFWPRQPAGPSVPPQHPAVLSVSPDPAKPYYVMRYVEPGHFPVRSAECALDAAKAWELRRRCRSLGEVHRHGLLHRDLKPANVLLDENGHAYWRTSGWCGIFVHDSLAVAGQSHCVGTAPYMSPLIAAGQAEDNAADIYSFGAPSTRC